MGVTAPPLIRVPRLAWWSVGCGLLCLAVVCGHVAAIAGGHPAASVWWALPLNAAGVLTSAWNVRGYVRRAVEQHRQQHG